MKKPFVIALALTTATLGGCATVQPYAPRNSAETQIMAFAGKAATNRVNAAIADIERSRQSADTQGEQVKLVQKWALISAE